MPPEFFGQDICGGCEGDGRAFPGPLVICPFCGGTGKNSERRRVEYRVEFDDKPRSFWDDPDNDGLWDVDREAVEDEADIHVQLGATNVRIVERCVEIEPEGDRS